MAALDFGMALARGMLPKAETAQKDLIDLAGGRNVFKSEDWWNKAVDEQIKSGYRKSEMATSYRTTSGEYKIGQRLASVYTGSVLTGLVGGVGKTSISYGVPQEAVITGYKPIPKGTGTSSFFSGGYGSGLSQPIPIYDTKPVEVFGPAGRTDFTVGELSDIEAAAKRGASRAKQEAAKAETAKKRLTRGTGGLAAKAIPVGGNGGTGLPELGAGGLQLGATSLGKGLFV